MSTVQQFIKLLDAHGSIVTYHRTPSMIVCPCVTPEGFRDPQWHEDHPDEPVCDEDGMLPDPDTEIHLTTKAFCQPIQSTRATRLTTEMLQQMFGTIEADDHLGIFPVQWGGITLQFWDWSNSGDEYVIYNGRKFIVVNANLFPDPSDGNPYHHWEIGMRIISD